MSVNLDQFRLIDSWHLVEPKRHVHLTDATTFKDNGKWFTTKNEKLFRHNKDEMLFRIECSEQDVVNESKFIVPDNNFFVSRFAEFFESVGYFKTDKITDELKKLIVNIKVLFAQ